MTFIIILYLHFIYLRGTQFFKKTVLKNNCYFQHILNGKTDPYHEEGAKNDALRMEDVFYAKFLCFTI